MSEIMAKMDYPDNLDNIVRKKEYLTIQESIRILKHLMEIIDDNHKEDKLLLRLNPSNIHLEENGRKTIFAVDIDGIHSKNISEQKEVLNYQNDLVGFRASEIALKDHKKIGKQSDYYAAAAIFYYCLTGRKISRLQMFRSEIPSINDVITRNSLNQNSGEILYKILKKGLASGINFRYHTSEEIQGDIAKLEKYLNGE